MLSKPIPIDPKLAELLERAKSHVMTDEEAAAQRKSWVKGEMMLEHPEMTDEQFEEIYLGAKQRMQTCGTSVLSVTSRCPG